VLGRAATALAAALVALVVFAGYQQSVIFSISSEHRSLVSSYASLLSQYQSAFSELSKLGEVVFARVVVLYNYRDGKTHTLHLSYPGRAYLSFRATYQHKPMTLDVRADYARKLVADAVPIIEGAASTILWSYAKGDKELYANMILQIAHQMLYNITTYAKSPVEVLVEGSGDCDNLAVLVAAFLKAVGINVVLVLGQTPGGAHAMLGVDLGRPPADPQKFGRTKLWYIDHGGRRYYLAEATWDATRVSPFDSRAPGFFVGDNPWGDTLKIYKVIEL